MTKARTLADFISDGSPLADGTISVAEVSGAAPIESPTFTGTVTVSDLTSTGNITLGDNDKAIFGAGSDLQIYHNNTSGGSFIDENGFGDLNIRSINGASIRLYSGGTAPSNTRLIASSSGEIKLYYSGSQKLTTTVDGVDITGKTTTDELDLSPIASTIADTAVDIFVYDTRKDSDGGAWRKRTQHTSWYNETLNTATRGSRKEFPAVAVIVAESNQVTIYDGDDPDLPMWMVFNVTGGGAIFGDSTNVIQSVVCLNGWMSVGSTRPSTTGNLSVADFIGDQSGFVYNNASDIRSQGNIADRNSTSQYPSGTSNFFTSDPIVNRDVNDVAMTVLPNAPIDAATGLPVPTIAVATDGGVSVIKDDGTVVDIKATNSAFYYTHQVSFTDDNKIILLYSYSGVADDTHVYYTEIPSSDKTFTAHSSAINANLDSNSYVTFLPQYTNQGSSLGGSKIIANKQFYGGNAAGLVHYSPEDDLTKSLASDITSTYNTGWMNGDIKLATLSDTDDTDVTGSELVTNGTFDTDTSGWSAAGGASLSVSSGRLQLTTSGSGLWAYQTINNVAAGTYTLSADVISNAGNRAYIRVGTTGANSSDVVNYGYIVGTGIQNQTFTITSTQNLTITLLYDAQPSSNLWDNVSLRLAEEDRSVNGNGLQVFGTVTKSAVATGADLVAYSGFSSSNYLEQPYNSDLDYSGDFVVMGWFKGSGSGQVQTAFHRRTANAANNIGLEIGFNTDNTFYFYMHDGLGQTNTALTGNAVATGVWTHFACVRNGQQMTTYLNGKQYLTATGTVRDITSSTAVCRIGAYISSSPVYGWQGDLALIRTSATAPSPEQIKKIYEDEKVLFQENAQATLYGSSDAVTALAYDDSTNLLHVGTSAGRSVFQGLRRVDNTTTAVGAAISASNGLVADE